MIRFLTRSIGVAIFLIGGAAVADIPMVTAPMLLGSPARLPALPNVQPARLAALKAATLPEDIHQTPPPKTELSAFGEPCGASVSPSVESDAMIALEVFAPCKPGSVINVSHGGLMFRATVPLIGAATLRFPAMQKVADIFVAIDDSIFERQIEVADAARFTRVALSSPRVSGFRMEASMLSEAVEIFHSAHADVLSVDMRDISQGATYRLSVTHKVTDQNCGAPARVSVHWVRPDLAAESQSLGFPATSCDEIGKILELKNIVPDLKVSAN